MIESTTFKVYFQLISEPLNGGCVFTTNSTRKSFKLSIITYNGRIRIHICLTIANLHTLLLMHLMIIFLKKIDDTK